MAPFVALLILVLLWRMTVLTVTAVFEMSGLSPQAARFEALSALTTSGFTTTQSEPVPQHAPSRRVAGLLFVVGYLGPTTGLALLGLGFLLPTAESGYTKTGVLVGIVAITVVLAYVPPLVTAQRWLALAVARRLARVPPTSPWATIGGYAVATIEVSPDSRLAGLRLDAWVAEAVRVLGVARSARSGGEYVSDPGRSLVTEAGDSVLVYGPHHLVRELRLAGWRAAS